MTSGRWDVMVDFEIYSPQADPARKALSYATTRRSLRQRFLSHLALLGAGVLFTMASVLIFDHVHQVDHRLVTQGVKVTGVIAAHDPGGYHRIGWIRVSYPVGRRHLTAEISLGHKVTRYTVGQRVDVYYDRERPARMTIPGVVNQSNGSTALMIGSLIVGIATALTALVKLWVGLRSRRILANLPWREVPATITLDSRNRVVAEVGEVDGPPSPAVFRSPSIAIMLGALGSKQGVWTTGHLWISGPRGHRAVLALPGGGDVLPLRSARSAAQGRRWILASIFR